MLVTMPIAGPVADMVTSRIAMIWFGTATAALAIPCVLLLGGTHSPSSSVLAWLTLITAMSSFSAPLYSWIIDLFPDKRVRYRVLGLWYNVGASGLSAVCTLLAAYIEVEHGLIGI